MHELALTKIQLEAEKERARLREETISTLKSDKQYLQDELARKDELVRDLVKTRSVDPPSSSGDWVWQAGLLNVLWHQGRGAPKYMHLAADPHLKIFTIV